MDKLLYIHGLYSSGNAFKAQLMKEHLTEYEIISPTLDYKSIPPLEIMQQLVGIITHKRPQLVVGSSLGGYYAICCCAACSVPVLAVNPVTNPIPLLHDIATKAEHDNDTKDVGQTRKQIAAYEQFQTDFFEHATPEGENLNFALANDDELLGNHHYLAQRYPEHNEMVFMDGCGHHFQRFEELIPLIRKLAEQ